MLPGSFLDISLLLNLRKTSCRNYFVGAFLASSDLCRFKPVYLSHVCAVTPSCALLLSCVFHSSEAMTALCFISPGNIGFIEGLELIRVAKTPASINETMATDVVAVLLLGLVCKSKLYRSVFCLSFSLAPGRFSSQARWRESLVVCLWTFRLREEEGEEILLCDWKWCTKWLHFYPPRWCGKQVRWLEVKVPLICSPGWESACRHC